jgi:GMP synthase-like glutamine amidotransferase
MRLHYLQHAPFEGPGNIEAWALDRGHTISGTRLYDGEEMPVLPPFDWLVVMGGPMNVNEEGLYPWLRSEKRIIREAIDGGKLVLGVCLGAQLISAALGGQVTKNMHKEIGWHEVKLTTEGLDSQVFGALPKTFMPMHWHGDTFSIPAGCARTAESEACAAQALECADGSVVGLQFHLDYSADDIEEMILNCSDELAYGKYVQNAAEIRSNAHRTIETKRLLYRLLDRMVKK